MDKKSSYFLYGYFGAGNFGDDVLLYSAIQNILAHDPEAAFLIRNHGPIDIEKDFPGRVQCADTERVYRSNVPDIVKFFIVLRSYWICMGRVSTLVVGGGTLIHDAPYLKSTFLLLCLTLIARLRRRRVYGIGLGTKSIKTFAGKLVVRLLIPRFDRLCLRDEDSLSLCRALTPAARNLALTADLAYALDWSQERRSQGRAIAVTLVDYMFGEGRNVRLLEILADTLTVFARQGYDIRFIALQREDADLRVAGDKAVLRRVIEKMPVEICAGRCSLITLEPNPAAIIEAYDGVVLMLGMRFHALVFAAMMGVPFTGLAHEPKIRAIGEEFSMPYLPLDRVDETALKTAMEQSMKKPVDMGLVDRYQRAAKENFIF